ncbi:PilZ domain-containing protein [Myxococcota bacterium]|nr:PilZ domain-containing protein [Myxococcota bacterium]MBU1382981.1 PilZ domain-containing protein [Myxococcota bacterium]MBU1499182.1 PilZ domain-containing protein [Myxococcota bacterium]
MTRIPKQSKEMRIHTIYLQSVSDFFRIYKSDSNSITFTTRAIFSNREEVILEILLLDTGEKEHFRTNTYIQKQTSTGQYKINALIQSGQNAKISFMEYLVNESDKWVTKRNHQRHPVSIKAAWSLEAPDLWHPCEIIDIGKGGLQVWGTATPPAGSRLLVNFRLPNSTASVKIRGEVVWVHQNEGKVSRMGMKFFDIEHDAETSRAKTSIRRFLRLYDIHGNINGVPNE